MIGLKKRLLGNRPLPSPESPPPDPERIQLATCVILLEAARSDDRFSEDERAAMITILEQTFHLSPPAAEELITWAVKAREESADLWEFTNLINRHYSTEEKKQVLEAAWQVIFADRTLDKYEDHLVHKLAKLLRLKHSDLIEAKMKVKYG